MHQCNICDGSAHAGKRVKTDVMEQISCCGEADPASEAASHRSYQVENLKASEVHGGFDEDGVVTYVWVLALQLGQRTEERAAAGDVHLAYRPLEWGGSDVGTEGSRWCALCYSGPAASASPGRK